MTNINPETGIRYGVIALASLHSDLAEELMHGPQTVDHSYNEARAEARHQFEVETDAIREQAEIAATERDPNMGAFDREVLIEDLEQDAYTRMGYSDAEDYVERQLQRWSDQYQCDEPSISGELEGVKYQVSWLGGAPILFVFESPLIAHAERLCSPCIPGAADLDGGLADGPLQGHQCYGVPQDWLDTDAI